MISKITGILSYRGVDHILIDVHGVGYEVFVADSTLAKLPHSGKKISVYTELIVREDLLQLVGFVTRREREWYRLLTGVQGVGAKAALKILGTFQLDVLSRSILIGDANAIKAAPGVGSKIAQRIVSELKDKAPSMMEFVPDENLNNEAFDKETSTDEDSERKNVVSSENSVVNPIELVENNSGQIQSEALSALTNLGYSSFDAALAVSDVLKDQEEFIEVQQLIKLALRNLSPKV